MQQPPRQPSASGLALKLDFFDRDVLVVAQALIGVSLKVASVGGLIVETEAYRNDDAASHSFRGLTPRNGVMFGPPARAYVYRSYGLHWCFNMTCGHGNGVLLRAIDPLFGVDQMFARRHVGDQRLLCSGPGRLSQALGIVGEMNGYKLLDPPFELKEGSGVAIVIGKRVGITRAQENLWRFGLKDSGYHSRKF